jgi:hypothetical protein
MTIGQTCTHASDDTFVTFLPTEFAKCGRMPISTQSRRTEYCGTEEPAGHHHETLFGLINALIPEQPDAHFIRRSAAADGASRFNPQPDPPQVWTQPNAGRTKAVSRSIISMALLTMSGAANEKEGLRSARGILEAFIDDFCGTSRPRLLLPAPWLRFDKRPNAVDVIVAGAQFHSAAQVPV